MKDEYIIINKTKLQQKIEELKKTGLAREYQITEYETLIEILSQSTPLIPEIEKAYMHCLSNEEFEDYISNLKLDI